MRNRRYPELYTLTSYFSDTYKNDHSKKVNKQPQRRSSILYQTHVPSASFAQKSEANVGKKVIIEAKVG